jgi:hypothetical protein
MRKNGLKASGECSLMIKMLAKNTAVISKAVFRAENLRVEVLEGLRVALQFLSVSIIFDIEPLR